MNKESIKQRKEEQRKQANIREGIFSEHEEATQRKGPWVYSRVFLARPSLVLFMTFKTFKTDNPNFPTEHNLQQTHKTRGAHKEDLSKAALKQQLDTDDNDRAAQNTSDIRGNSTARWHCDLAL